ncbi:MAG: uracil-DNA glycosylase [Armatimonadota bacterium]|nr:uracil-DNA glycosylase [Armatimonadota bacterium]MDR5697057.1 uracil-DNA glycosylase [Armatimonadota bacterium]
MSAAPSPAEVLERIAEQIRSCTICPLSHSRSQAVPGEGPPDAPVLFVGEGPGSEEDAQGRPFVGAAGRLLDKLLSGIRMPRTKVFITNTVRCRPPGNRTPTPDEVAACLPYLIRQMAVLRPRVVCLLGGTATAALLGADRKIGRIRGRAIREAGRWFFATYHPAAALRSSGLGEILQDDFRRLRRLVDVEWGTADPARWNPGALHKIFASLEPREPVEISGDGAVRLTWEVGGVHPVFRTESALAELGRRFVLRRRRLPAQTEVEWISFEIVDASGRRTNADSDAAAHLQGELRIRA